MIQSIVYMEEIAISKFKATCLAVMERVRRTRQPVLAETAEIVGDIVSPAGEPEDWETIRS